MFYSVGVCVCQSFKTTKYVRKHKKQESCARKPCDAAAVLLSLKFSDNIHCEF